MTRLTDSDLKAIESDASCEGVSEAWRETALRLVSEVLALRAELALANAVCESTDLAMQDGPMETYCDVGAPDDCDHCVIVNLLEAWRFGKVTT
jgi:hypothetical protein